MLNITKILIISVFAFTIIQSFVPFYIVSPDSHLYAVTAIRLATDGEYSYENEMYKETLRNEFFVFQHSPTLTEDWVPRAAPGFIYMLSFFFLIGNYWSLFFIGPISTILLLIFSERIATKLFNPYVGLFTLILVSTSYMIFYFGRFLLTDNTYALIFLLGCFTLIKFLKNNYDIKLGIISSSLFAFASLIRFPGFFAFPVEIFLILAVLLFFKPPKKSFFQRFKFSAKSVSLISLPWIAFLLFFFIFNTYYFGDPFSTYEDALNSLLGVNDTKGKSTDLTFNQQNFESFKDNLKPFFPNTVQNISDYLHQTKVFHFLDGRNNEIFIIFIIVLVLSFTISIKRKQNLLENVVLVSFMMVTLFYFSTRNECSPNCIERYMITNIPLFAMFFGLLIFNGINLSLSLILKNKPNKNNFVIVIFVFLLLIIAYVEFDQSGILSKFIIATEKDFVNPEKMIKDRYPLHKESHSIVLSRLSSPVIEFDAIQYRPYAVYDVRPNKYPGVNSTSIDYLKELIIDGQSVLVWKNPRYDVESILYDELQEKYNFTINYDFCSKYFCQLLYEDKK